ncbi:MAG: ankyrin repeat domain-containing protein [bacterium]|nr:ankyrin repeat domain-containing protein [bacterium]
MQINKSILKKVVIPTVIAIPVILYLLSFLLMGRTVIDFVPLDDRSVVLLEEIKDTFSPIHPKYTKTNYRLAIIDTIEDSKNTISLNFLGTNEEASISLVKTTGSSFISDYSLNKKRSAAVDKVFSYIVTKQYSGNESKQEIIHFAVDLGTNKVLWNETLDGENSPAGLGLMSDSTSMFRMRKALGKKGGQMLEAINPQTGKVLWTFNQFKNAPESPLFFDNYLAVKDGSSAIVLFDKKTGHYDTIDELSGVDKFVQHRNMIYYDGTKGKRHTSLRVYNIKQKKSMSAHGVDRYLGYLLGKSGYGLFYTHGKRSRYPVLLGYRPSSMGVRWDKFFPEYPSMQVVDSLGDSRLLQHAPERHPLYSMRHRFVPVMLRGNTDWTLNNDFQNLIYLVIDTMRGDVVFSSRAVEMYYKGFSPEDTMYIYEQGTYYCLAPLKGQDSTALLMYEPVIETLKPKPGKKTADKKAAPEKSGLVTMFEVNPCIIPVTGDPLCKVFKRSLRIYSDSDAIYPSKKLQKAISNKHLYLIVDDCLYVVDTAAMKVVFGDPDDIILKDTFPAAMTNLTEGLDRNTRLLTETEISDAAAAAAKPESADALNKLLWQAVDNDDFDGISQLVKKGASLETTDDKKFTILLRAVNHRQYDMVKSLLKQGASVKHKAGKGFTALNYAIANKDFAMAKLLLKKKAPVESRLENKHTVLMHAVTERNYGMVRLLLRNGALVADVADGKNVLDIAKEINKEHKIKAIIRVLDTSLKNYRKKLAREKKAALKKERAEKRKAAIKKRADARKAAIEKRKAAAKKKIEDRKKAAAKKKAATKKKAPAKAGAK